MKQTLYMETTQIRPEKTAGEIMELLVRANARQIALEYGEKHTLCGMAFVILVDGRAVPFKLPARVEPVFRLLNNRRPEGSWKRGNREDGSAADREQAERVAWRQLLRWVQAQIAMIETGMVAVQEVFLPYAQNQDGRTLYEAISGSGFKQLAAPEVKP